VTVRVALAVAVLDPVPVVLSVEAGVEKAVGEVVWAAEPVEDTV
jgi:hypothetical protein